MRFINSYLGYLTIIGMIACALYCKAIKPSIIKKTIKSFLILAFIFILFMQSLVLSEFTAKVEPSIELDYLIVLGAGLKGDKVSHTLAYRLDAAKAYLEQHPRTKVIVSGGQGPDEWVSEAVAMKRYLVKSGLDANRIILEDQSTSTEENIKYSKALMSSEDQVAIVSSNYHMYRAKYIAKPLLTNAQGISAPSPYWSLLNYMVRESFTIVNEWRKM